MFSKGSFGTPFPFNTQRSPRQNSEPADSSQGSPARDTIFPNHAKEGHVSGHKSQDPNRLLSPRNVTTPRRESFDQYRGMMNIPHSSSNCSDFGGTLSKDTYGSEQTVQSQSRQASTLAADNSNKSVETIKAKRKRPKFIRKVTC